jgi:hypothetical protein
LLLRDGNLSIHATALNIELLRIHSGEWANRIGKHLSVLFAARGLAEAACGFNINFLSAETGRVGIDPFARHLALENRPQRRREFLCLGLCRSEGQCGGGFEAGAVAARGVGRQGELTHDQQPPEPLAQFDWGDRAGL